MRTFGLEHLAKPRPLQTLAVRHIMRSSVKVIPAAARFDEVLHFVEGSRHNHFPVVDDEGQYVGMIHFGDLRNIMYDPFVRELVTAHDLSRQDAPLTTPELALDDLFELFHATHVDSLAVISNAESRAIIGIVEQRDLLLLMHRSQKGDVAT
jgi:CIC family chloride channel protein